MLTNGFNVNELKLKFTGSARLSSGKTMEDSGIDLNAVEIKETELGLYATYIYKADQFKEEQYIRFVLSDTEGNKFNYMPYYINGGEEILDNGYHKVTYAYQKPENVSDLHLYISGVAEELDEVPVELTIIE